MSVFTPHPSAPASVRVVQRTMVIQFVYVVIFAALNQSHRGDYNYYQPNETLVAFQVLLGIGVLGCAYGVGRLAPWSLPASFVVEVASLALGIYSLVDSHSGLAAGFIIAGFNLYRLAQADVQQALKAGPPSGQYGGQPPYGAQAPFGGPQTPYSGQPPYAGQPYAGQQPYGAPNPYDAQPQYGQPQYGAQPYGAPQPYTAPPPYSGQQPPSGLPAPGAVPQPPETDYYGRPLNPPA